MGLVDSQRVLREIILASYQEQASSAATSDDIGGGGTIGAGLVVR